MFVKEERKKGIVSILLLALLPAVEASFVEQWLGIGRVLLVIISPSSHSPPFIMNTHGSSLFFPIIDSLLSCMIFSQYLDFHVPVIFLLLTLNAVTLRRVYFSSLTTDGFLLDLEAFLWGYLLWLDSVDCSKFLPISLP